MSNLSYVYMSIYKTVTMIIVYVNVCVKTFIYRGCYIYVYHTFDCELKFSRLKAYIHALPTETKNEGTY